MIEVSPTLFPNHVRLFFGLGVLLAGGSLLSAIALLIWSQKGKTKDGEQVRPAIRIGSIEDSTLSDIDVTAEQALDIGQAKGLTVKGLRLRRSDFDKRR